ncbi:hypothetical protein J3Q64DRAFT_1879852, partial [Phycomyces blakesleeanus]
AGIGKCVFYNPGRHNLLYLIHKGRTSKRKFAYRYTRNQKSVGTNAKKKTESSGTA